MRKLIFSLLLSAFGLTQLQAQLFINEIDYDQPGTDNAEFVELAGPAGTYQNVVLELVNGYDGSVYLTADLGTITLQDETDGYGFFVVGAATVPNVDVTPPGWPATNIIQNGAPDGVQLRVNGSIVDAVAYEGPLNDTDGNPMEDVSSYGDDMWEGGEGLSIGRLGLDGSPWAVLNSSPGVANPGQVLNPNANIPPIANAGSDQTVAVGDTVTLDGSASLDADGSIVSYAWEQTGGPTVTLDNPQSAITHFVVPEVTSTTDFTFRLIVTDDDGAADSDEVVITAMIITEMTIAEARQQSEGTLVTVRGIVISYNWSSSSSDYNFQDSTAGLDLYLNGTNLGLNPGDEIRVTGTISSYHGKLEVIPSDASQVTVLSTGNALPEPRVITVAELNSQGETWESTLIRINQVSKVSGTWPAAGSNENIDITDNGTDVGVMRIDKETDIDGSPEPTWPVDIIGVLSEYDGTYQLMPRSLEDILVNTSAPTFTAFTLSPDFITDADEITLSVDITPAEGAPALASGTLYYGNGENLLNSTEMWLDHGNTWMGIIPAQTGNTELAYQVEVTDADGQSYSSAIQTVLIASSTPTSIAQIQSTPIVDEIVTIHGVVTIGSGILSTSYTKAYVQDESGRGIQLYDPMLQTFNRGDAVELVGRVSIYNNIVELVDFVTNYTGVEQPLPAVSEITVGAANSDAWQSTLIGFSATIADIQYFSGGTKLYVADQGDTTAVVIYRSTGIDSSQFTVGSDWHFIGVGSVYNSEYELLVGYQEDLTPGTAIGDELAARPKLFALAPPYPNPFNPAVTLNWTTSRRGQYRLEVYDLQGRLIQTLLNKELPAGTYQVRWQPRNTAAGVYFFRLNGPQGNLIQKAVLLK